MISRTTLILSTLALGTLAIQDIQAGCKNGVCTMKKAPKTRNVQQIRTVTRTAAVRATKKTGCRKCKRTKRVTVVQKNRNGRIVRKVATVQACTDDSCPLVRK